MTHGMIVAPQPEAVEAGARALMQGGNAVDAAVACALVQTVVDPCMAGIAGFGTMHLYLPERGFHGFIDFHTRAPAAVREDMWAGLIEGEARDGFGFFLRGRVNEVGYQSIMVPGSLEAYREAALGYGTMAWDELVAPAVDHAAQGVVVRPHMYEFWTRRHDMGRVPTVEKLRFTESGRRIFFDDEGRLHRPGACLRNADMARTLERIAAQGADTLYRGAMGEAAVADIRANGGLLSLEDLDAYRIQRSKPLWSSYRGFRVATNQPPGGGVMLLEMLNILEHFDLAALGHNSPEYVRVVAEAMKCATADKDAGVGDPRFVDVPLDRLVDKAYAGELASAIERGEKAQVQRLHQPTESRDTTHVSVVDEHGNAVAMTHSLGMPSGVITPGLGFMYNGCMSVFDPRPGRAGSIAPGKSRFTAMAPTIVFRGEDPYIVIGAPGGAWITMGILQSILNVIDFRMSMSDAVAAPRFSANSDVIDISNRIPRYVQQAVEAMGYVVARSHLSYAFAGVHGIQFVDGRWVGGADPGRDGMALEV